MNHITQIIKQSFQAARAAFCEIQSIDYKQKLNIVLCITLILCESTLHALATTMNHRSVTSSPLLYKQIDYSEKKVSIDFEPLVSGAFDPTHIMANLTPGGATTLSLNQQGNGDINSAWLYLQAPFQDYNSTVTFTPTQQIYGGLFHCYKQFAYSFFDVRTSLLHCKTQVNLAEVGGNNGVLENYDNNIMYNAYDAFSQNDYQYGKMGEARTVIGFDNIQILVGASTRVATMQREQSQSYIAGFALVEVPTGAGTQAEWLFEPQVGGNHWAFGFGVDCMFVADNDVSFVFGGNFRHFIANWETRIFDLQENGPWSRYLLVEPLSNIQGGSITGYPAINIVTQPALIEGRNQITMYGRLQKKCEDCLFEISYNLFYDEAELIQRITPIPSGYGIYAIQSTGGVTTASTAKINQALPAEDSLAGGPIELVTSDLDFASGSAGMWLNNTIAARLQRVQEFYRYGVGASVDLAGTAQGLSSWSVWANFEILLP